MYRKLTALAAIALLQAAAFDAAADCAAGNPNLAMNESQPTNVYTNNGDGTVTHNLTGLTWKRCVEGRSGPNCATGTPASMSWDAALAASVADRTAGQADWRLPNKKELESIVETCGFNPTINLNAFPATPSQYYWTSSTYGTAPDNAWFVNFNVGYTSHYAKATGFNVRLVRGGPVFDAAANKVVVEYRDTADFPNSPGGHFFYSADPAEQAAVDAGAAGQFVRTGRRFATGGTSDVCRFYGSISPGPNSHFFTVDASECNALKAQQITPPPANVQQWNYEGIAYQTTPALIDANGARSCPDNTAPLYRAYNNAFPASGGRNPWDSNHRLTPFLADIAEVVSVGWRDEGLVFCTAQ